MQRFLTPKAIISLLLIPACDPDTGFADGLESRPAEFRSTILEEPDPGQVTIFREDETNAEEQIIWEIEEGGVRGGAPSNPLLLTVDEQGISDSAGNVLCAYDSGPSSGLPVIRNEMGTVLLTALNSRVYVGSLNLEGSPPAYIENLLASKLLYTFQDEYIYEGDPSEAPAILVASDSTALVAPTRQLLVTALAQGICGSSGLPD